MKKLLKDFFFAIICFFLINIIVHEIGHLIPFMISDIHNAKVTVKIFGWSYKTTMSGFGLIPSVYISGLIALAGGWLAGITAFHLYLKLEFLNYPILKTAMLFSVVSQLIYGGLELFANSTVFHSILVGWALAVPITIIILYMQAKKQKLLLEFGNNNTT